MLKALKVKLNDYVNYSLDIKRKRKKEIFSPKNKNSALYSVSAA